jgi:hypothetical protein
LVSSISEEVSTEAFCFNEDLLPMGGHQSTPRMGEL